jgi:hypothetical protein
MLLGAGDLENGTEAPAIPTGRVDFLGRNRRRETLTARCALMIEEAPLRRFVPKRQRDPADYIHHRLRSSAPVDERLLLRIFRDASLAQWCGAGRDVDA